MNKVTYKDCPELFDNIVEFEYDNHMEHRRGSNFFRTGYIEFVQSDKQYFPTIENFDKYVGQWQTNSVIWDDNHGFDETYSEITRYNSPLTTAQHIVKFASEFLYAQEPSQQEFFTKQATQYIANNKLS